jgi:uncharacterized membrane protein
MVRRQLLLSLALALGMAELGLAAEFFGLGQIGGNTAEIQGLSPDGKVAVGSYGPDLLLPFRWSEGTGLQALPVAAGGEDRGEARAATADGSIIVGYGSTAAVPLNEAVRWVDGGAPAGLGDLPGGAANSEAADVSFDAAPKAAAWRAWAT